MTNKIKNFILLIFIMFLLAGCANKTEQTITNTTKENEIVETEKENIISENKLEEKNKLSQAEQEAIQKADKIVKQVNSNFKFDYTTQKDNIISAKYSFDNINLSIDFDYNNIINLIYLRTTDTNNKNYSNIAVALPLIDELQFSTDEIVKATTIIQCITPEGLQDFATGYVGNYKISSSKSNYINIVTIELK